MSTSPAQASTPKAPPGGLFRFISNPSLYLLTLFRGKYIGRDAVANQYYERPGNKGSTHTRRWVVYAGAPDASSVAPEWHAWLHHLTDAPLPETTDEPWRKPYLPNLTGTPEHYQPTPTASTGYRAWTPDQA